MTKSIVTYLYDIKYLSYLDVAFGRFLSQFSPDRNEDVMLAAALASRAAADGNTCLDLSLATARQLPRTGTMPAPNLSLDAADWQEKLERSPAVGKPGQQRPLIIDARGRIYLYRYWHYERMVAEGIRQRLQRGAEGVDTEILKNSLQRIFAQSESDQIDWQKVAVTAANLGKFCVITGGPGTGKTFTIAAVLAALLEQPDSAKLRFFLAAPTGKAAVRLKMTLNEAVKRLDGCEHLKARFPEEVYTIHRMLKPISHSPYFYHNADNPLPADAVIIDEASMVDVALMAKLLQSLPVEARLILIGDQDQLASVEAGSVLADICGRDINQRYSGAFCRQIRELSGEQIDSDSEPADEDSRPLGNHIIALQRSYRFSEGSGIQKLSTAVKAGDASGVLDLLSAEREPAIAWLEMKPGSAFTGVLSAKFIAHYRSLLSSSEPQTALQKLNRFQLLCAVKEGPYGVSALNRWTERLLWQHTLIAGHDMSDDAWYRGRPVLVTRNDYYSGLFNGDIGITLRDPAAGANALAVYFLKDVRTVKQILIHLLPPHETAFALTVHKSQGSEFEEIFLILPDEDSPLLTRELLYTAITRAKQRVSIWARKDILVKAVKRQVQRTSGLRDKLWQC